MITFHKSKNNALTEPFPNLPAPLLLPLPSGNSPGTAQGRACLANTPLTAYASLHILLPCIIPVFLFLLPGKNTFFVLLVVAGLSCYACCNDRNDRQPPKIFTCVFLHILIQS